MKTFWNWLRGIELEFEHIVSEFENAITKLHNLADRKLITADALGADITAKSLLKDDAERVAEKAALTAGKLSQLIG